MNRVAPMLSAVLLSAATASAQEFPEIRPMKGERLDFVTSIQREYLRIKINMTEEAERMPEDDYAFRPTKDIRSVRRADGPHHEFPVQHLRGAAGRSQPESGHQ